MLRQRSTILLLLIVLSLILLACTLTDTVQKFAEPIDTRGCRVDCARADMDFGHYVYVSNSCWCVGEDGNEVKLYGLELGE